MEAATARERYAHSLPARLDPLSDIQRRRKRAVFGDDFQNQRAHHESSTGGTAVPHLRENPLAAEREVDRRPRRDGPRRYQPHAISRNNSKLGSPAFAVRPT